MAKSISSGDRAATASPISIQKSRDSDQEPSPRKLTHCQQVEQGRNRKSAVVDLISRLTASTAASRSKKRDKNDTPSPGPHHADVSSFRSISSPATIQSVSSPSLFHRLTFGENSPPKRPVISRPMPAPLPPNELSLVRVRNSSRTLRTASPAPSVRSVASVRPTSPAPLGDDDASRSVSSRTAQWPSPQRVRNVSSGRSSALGRPTQPIRSTSRQRAPSAPNSAPSRIVELKAKVAELERIIQTEQSKPDERIARLEEELAAERAHRSDLERRLDTPELTAGAVFPEPEAAPPRPAVSQDTHELEEMLSQLQQVYDDADVLKVARDNLEYQVKGLQVSHRTLEYQLAMSKRDAQRCRRSLTSVERQVKELQAQLEEKTLENDELSQTIERIMRAAQHYSRMSSDSQVSPDSSGGSLGSGAKDQPKRGKSRDVSNSSSAASTPHKEVLRRFGSRESSAASSLASTPTVKSIRQVGHGSPASTKSKPRQREISELKQRFVKKDIGLGTLMP